MDRSQYKRADASLNKIGIDLYKNGILKKIM